MTSKVSYEVCVCGGISVRGVLIITRTYCIRSGVGSYKKGETITNILIKVTVVSISTEYPKGRKSHDILQNKWFDGETDLSLADVLFRIIVRLRFH